MLSSLVWIGLTAGLVAGCLLAFAMPRVWAAGVLAGVLVLLALRVAGLYARLAELEREKLRVWMNG